MVDLWQYQFWASREFEGVGKIAEELSSGRAKHLFRVSGSSNQGETLISPMLSSDALIDLAAAAYPAS